MRRPLAVLTLAAAALALTPISARETRDGPVSEPAAQAAPPSGAVVAPAPALPLEVDVRFDLTDQTGRRRTPEDFRGRPWLVFFGYSRCTDICSVALPRMAETLDILDAQGVAIDTVMITVDAEGDTPAAMAEKLPDHHPAILGLTGPDDALAEAREAFHVQAKKVFELADGTPVIAHGTFIWLIGPDGEVEAALPPQLDAERIAEIVRSRL